MSVEGNRDLSPNDQHPLRSTQTMSPPLSTIRPLLLAHSLPHIPKYGFSQSALSLASLSLPPPYHYAEPLNPASLQTLFGSGREPERALFQEWLEEKRRELKAEFKTQEVGKGGEKEERKRLRRVLERRLEMNQEVRKWLVDVRPSLPLSLASCCRFTEDRSSPTFLCQRDR
jgi:ubiquinone biosynthesis protein COQ9